MGRLLPAGLALAVVSGVLLAVLDTRHLPGFQTAVNVAVWGDPSMPPDVIAYHRWLYTVVGAVIAGWAASMLVVARTAPPVTTRRALVAGLAAWFVVDTGGSLFHGVWPNAALDGVCLAVAAVGLWVTRRHTAF